METIESKIQDQVMGIVLLTIAMVLFVGLVIWAAEDVHGITAMVFYCFGAFTIVVLFILSIHHVCDTIIDLVKTEIFNRELFVLEEIGKEMPYVEQR